MEFKERSTILPMDSTSKLNGRYKWINLPKASKNGKKETSKWVILRK